MIVRVTHDSQRDPDSQGDRDRGGLVVRGALTVRGTPIVGWALAVKGLFIVRRAHDSHRGP